MKNKVIGVEYLERVLQWKAFCKCHSKFVVALRAVLDELYDLRNKVEKDGAK